MHITELAIAISNLPLREIDSNDMELGAARQAMVHNVSKKKSLCSQNQK